MRILTLLLFIPLALPGSALIVAPAPDACLFSGNDDLHPHCIVQKNGHPYVVPQLLPMLRSKDTGFGGNGGHFGLIDIRIGSNWSYVNRTGRVVIDSAAMFDNGPEKFHRGLVRVKVGDKEGFANTSGVLVIPPTYDGVRAFDRDERGVAFGCKGCKIVRTGEYHQFVGGNWFRIWPSGRAVKIPSDKPWMLETTPLH